MTTTSGNWERRQAGETVQIRDGEVDPYMEHALDLLGVRLNPGSSQAFAIGRAVELLVGRVLVLEGRHRTVQAPPPDHVRAASEGGMKIWRISVPAAITVPVKLTINDIRIGLLVLEAGQSLVVRRDGDAVELDVTP